MTLQEALITDHRADVRKEKCAFELNRGFDGLARGKEPSKMGLVYVSLERKPHPPSSLCSIKDQLLL
jgi:hypothetical protein